ncbi:MAG: hypothetical protein HKN47_17580 [Pirellulaceae bacterium]|nr:hypothetical protein [Pirellulaceae bacterium]
MNVYKRFEILANFRVKAGVVQQLRPVSDTLAIWTDLPVVADDAPDEVDLVTVGNPPIRQGS